MFKGDSRPRGGSSVLKGTAGHNGTAGGSVNQEYYGRVSGRMKPPMGSRH